MKKAFWWRVACYVRAIGEKHDLSPAEHTVAARGLFDFTVLRGIHIFVFFGHDSCGRVMGSRDKTPFLSVFWGAADLTVLWGIICLKHKKTRSWNTQKWGRRWQDAYPLPARRRQKSANSCFVRWRHHFLWPRSALNAAYPRDAGSRSRPNRPHVKDLPGLAGANSLKLLLLLLLKYEY